MLELSENKCKSNSKNTPPPPPHTHTHIYIAIIGAFQFATREKWMKARLIFTGPVRKTQLPGTHAKIL